MTPRPGLNQQNVVAAAIDLVDREGLAGLSLAALADQVGVRPPSLYNHVAGLDDLRQLMTIAGLEELTGMMQRAAMGRSGFEALTAVSRAYRDFARRHPGLYPLTIRSTEKAGPTLQAAGQAAVEVVLAVLQAYHLSDEAALHATRCLRSALHGFVLLELDGGFGLPLDLDETFDRLLKMIDCGLRQSF